MYSTDRCMVEVYKFPIDGVPDIIEIKKITETEVEVYHVEEDANGTEILREKLTPHDTKEMSLGKVNWDAVDQAVSTLAHIHKPNGVAADLKNSNSKLLSSSPENKIIVETININYS